MGTRSNIIVQQRGHDGRHDLDNADDEMIAEIMLAPDTWKRIYCHWDGYPSHNGRMLLDHYNSQALAEAVVALGDMSSLSERCDKPAGHSYDKPVKGYTVYYNRDRGETDTFGVVGDTLKAVWPSEDTWTGYVYVWRDNKWWVAYPKSGPEGLKLVSDVLVNESILDESGE